MKNKPEYVIRTVKNGCVKIFGRTFSPFELNCKYEAFFEDEALKFGLFYNPSGDLLSPVLLCEYEDPNKNSENVNYLAAFVWWNEK